MKQFNKKIIKPFLKLTCMLIFLGILLISCSSAIKFPCNQNVHPDLIKTTILPVKAGNNWKYLVHRNDKSSDTYNTTSIIGLDTLSYTDSTGAKTVLAYKIDLSTTAKNSGKNYMQYYYIVCESNILMVKCDESKIIREYAILNDFPENPQAGKIDYYNEKAWWKGTEEITTKFGKLLCYVWEKIDAFDKVHFTPSGPNLKAIKGDYTITRLYFSKGIGLVKSEMIDKKGKVTTAMDIDSYELK